jgi:hypothetical protein
MCVWDNARTRYPLCAAASFDGGRTWTRPKDIAGPTGGRQASYPGCEQAADGTLVAVWQQDVEGGRDVRCARFSLAWLLADPVKQLQQELAGMTVPTTLGKATVYAAREILRSSDWQVHRPQGKPIGGTLTDSGSMQLATNGGYHIDNNPALWDGNKDQIVEFRMRVLGREAGSGSHSAAEVWIGGSGPDSGCQLFVREDAVAFDSSYLVSQQLDATAPHTYRIWTDLSAGKAYLAIDEATRPVLVTRLGACDGLNINRILVGDSSGGPDVAGRSEWLYVSWRAVGGE